MERLTAQRYGTNLIVVQSTWGYIKKSMYHERLMDAGGRINRNLTCGQGWTFLAKFENRVSRIIDETGGSNLLDHPPIPNKWMIQQSNQ